MEVIVIIALVAGFIWLVSKGGVAGLIAEQQVKSQVARHTAGAPEKSGKITSNYNSVTTSETPAGVENASASRAQRLAEIDAFFNNDLNAMEVKVGACVPDIIPKKSLGRTATSIQEKFAKFNDIKNPNMFGLLLQVGEAGYQGGMASAALENAIFRRTLRDMSDSERSLLRLSEILQEVGQINTRDALKIRVPILWNGGKTLITTIEAYNVADKRAALDEGLRMLIGAHFGDVATASELVQTSLRKALAPDSSLAPDDRALLERYLFSGNRWLTPDEANRLTKIDQHSPTALRLGRFEGTDTDLVYDWRESLISIAPPGAGKSQAQVLRNLLQMKGPAVVLDVKGEMWSGSSLWRHYEVGPVLRFAPGQPEYSLRYNPLDWVRSHPQVAWDDARRLADLLIVPMATDQYFESRARDLITMCILDVAIHAPPEKRNMDAVLDRLYPGSDEQLWSWCEQLEASSVSQLKRQSAALKVMPLKQREGIFDAARNQLEVWQSPALSTLTAASDLNPLMFRQHNATLYLCVGLEDVKKYSSVLRVIIGQIIGVLCQVKPESEVRPVTFFLDELPRLGHMDVIEQALDVGRGFGVRLWMFCQNRGQLAAAYKNADGMIGNCAAQCYMNPDAETAHVLSRNLGVRQGLLDGRQKPLAEPQQLIGPEFYNKIVVFLRGCPPAKLDKAMAFEDAVCMANNQRAAARHQQQPQASTG